MYVQIVERNPGTLTELNLLSGTPPVPQHYLWSVNIISETVLTIKKRAKREQQETFVKFKLINAIICQLQSIEKCDGRKQPKSDADVLKKNRIKISYMLSQNIQSSCQSSDSCKN